MSKPTLSTCSTMFSPVSPISELLSPLISFTYCSPSSTDTMRSARKHPRTSALSSVPSSPFDPIELMVTPQITIYAQEHSNADNLKGLWTDIFHRTFPITRSNNGYERLGAVAGIG